MAESDWLLGPSCTYQHVLDESSHGQASRVELGSV